MIFEGDLLKGYRIDSFNDKVIKIDLPNVEECRINTMKITVEDINFVRAAGKDEFDVYLEGEI